MAEIKLSEKMVYVVNPCPDLSEAQLYAATKKIMPNKKAPPARANAEKRSAFAIEFIYSAGVERETVPIPPGTQMPLQESIARQVYKECGEQGLALVPIAADPLVRARSVLSALRTSAEWYASNGLKRLSKLSRGHKWSDNDLVLMAYEHAQYYVNQYKSELLTALADKIEAKIPKLEEEYGVKEEAEEVAAAKKPSLAPGLEEAPAIV